MVWPIKPRHWPVNMSFRLIRSRYYAMVGIVTTVRQGVRTGRVRRCEGLKVGMHVGAGGCSYGIMCV